MKIRSTYHRKNVIFQGHAVPHTKIKANMLLHYHKYHLLRKKFDHHFLIVFYRATCARTKRPSVLRLAETVINKIDTARQRGEPFTRRGCSMRRPSVPWTGWATTADRTRSFWERLARHGTDSQTTASAPGRRSSRWTGWKRYRWALTAKRRWQIVLEEGKVIQWAQFNFDDHSLKKKTGDFTCFT